MLLYCLFMSVELVVVSPLVPNVSDLFPDSQLARLYLLPRRKKKPNCSLIFFLSIWILTIPFLSDPSSFSCFTLDLICLSFSSFLENLLSFCVFVHVYTQKSTRTEVRGQVRWLPPLLSASWFLNKYF